MPVNAPVTAWAEANSYTDSDLRETMQAMAKALPLGEIQTALKEIKTEKNHVFHQQPAVGNVRSWRGLLVTALLAVRNIPDLLIGGGGGGGSGDADARLSRMPREAGGMAASYLDAATASPMIEEITDASPPSTQTILPENETVAAQMPDWMGIDWRAFDEVKFLRACGVQLGDDTLSGRLRGMHECLGPQPDTDKLPLDITQSDNAERFYDAVIASTGYAYKTAAPTDPAFLQYLFKSWFQAFTAVQAGSDIHTAPLQRDLLELTHPNAPHRNKCSDGMDIDPLLPRVGDLKKKLRASYLKPYQQFGARSYLESNHQSGAEAAHDWEFEGLCQLSEPTLARRDLPEAFRYGSLAWVQLSIGIALAGDDHPNLTLPELIALATVSDVFAGDPDDPGLLAIRRTATQAVLRMAHAHGKLDLSASSEITQEHLEIAFDFYRSQWALEESKLPPLEQLAASLPTRLDTAKRMLTERGMKDLERRYGAFNQYLPGQGKVYGPNTPHKPSCIPWDRTYTLPEIFMMGDACLEQMHSWPSSPLLEREQDLLDVPMLTHAELERRFQQDFDAAWPQLARAILVPALQDQIESLGTDKRFWCGDARLRLPTALIETRFGGGRQYKGGTGVGAQATEWVRYTAKDALLVELVLGEGAHKETRNYWIKLNPLEMKPYEKSTEDLLKEDMHRFFKPGDGDELLGMSSRRAPTYEQYKPGGVHGNLLETISMVLLRDHGAALLASAHQTTDPEKYRAQLREMLLDLIPLHACIRTLRAGENYAATLHCTFDIFSFFPFIRAGGKLGKTGASIAAGLTKERIKNLGKAVLLDSVESGGRKAIEDVLKVMPQAVNLAKAGFGVIDPGFGFAYGLGNFAFRFGKTGAGLLAKKWQGYDALSRIRKIVEEGSRQADKFYPKRGYWHARDNVIMQSGAERYLHDGGRRYGVFDWGQHKNILTMPAGEHLRLVNPQSGKGYGPLMRRSGASGRIELITSTNGGDAAKAVVHPISPDVLARGEIRCRSKRAGDAVCHVPLLPAPRFGDHSYAQGNPALLMKSQLVVNEAGETVLQIVNLRDVGFEEWLLDADERWRPMAPAVSAQPDPATGAWKGIDAAMPLSDQLSGEVMVIPDRYGTAASYLRVEFFSGNAQDDRMMHIRYLPFASYQDADGTLMHQVVIGGRRYSFRMNRDQGAMAAGGDVALYPATAEEMRKFEKYQELLETPRNAPGIDLASAVRLRDQSGAFRREFETVMISAETKLIDAIAVFEDRQGLVSTICEKFTGGDKAAAALLSAKLGALMRRMLAALPDLSDQSGHAIGFFTNPAGIEFNRISGLAVRNSMAYPLDFRYMKEAVIFFNSRYFDPAIPLEKRIANLLHEWTHALAGTWDSMTGEGGAPLYVAHHLGRYDLAPLIEAARLPGSDPMRHAVWVEHIVMILANFRYPSTRHLSEPFVRGTFYATSYKDFSLPALAGRPRTNVPVCRPKRAGDGAYAMICPVPLAPDARFGADGYAQQHAARLMGSQLSVTEAGGTTPRTVNLLDIGFAASRLVSQTWVPAVPAVSSFYNQVSGRMQGADSTLLGFDTLRGSVVRRMNREGNGESEYVLFKFTDTDAQNEISLQTRYLPFGSYQDADGTLVGYFAFGAHHYSFRVDSNRILSDGDNSVEIHRATEIERNKFEKYQDILAFDYSFEWINYPGIVKLRGLSPERKAQFGLVMDRAEAILHDALAVLNEHPEIASKICGRFAADASAATGVIDAVKKSAERMAQSFAHLRRQSGDAIGFFTYLRGTPVSHKKLNGFAIANSMKYSMDFRNVKKTVINLSSAYLRDANRLKDSQAMLLLHEWSHACEGTEDWINGVGQEDIYAQGLDGRYDLKPLIDAARISGAPALHASTLEHILLMLAYARRPETRSGVASFLNGGNHYQRLFTASDFKAISDGIYDPGPAPVGTGVLRR